MDIVEQGWVLEREKKISQLEDMASHGPGNIPENDLKTSAPEGDNLSNGHDLDTTLSLDNHLQKMRRLEVEMEKDLTIFGIF